MGGRPAIGISALTRSGPGVRGAAGAPRSYLPREPEAFRPDSLSADFRELYLLTPDPISDLYQADPNEPRRDDRAVQRLRTRMCRELNFATSSVYCAARYIAEAQSVARRINESRHGLPQSAARDLSEAVVSVATALQGPGGAGIAVEQ